MKKIIVIFLLVAFCLLVVETVLKIWFFNFAPPKVFARFIYYDEVPVHQRKYSPHHYLNYCLTPGYKSRFSNNRHNSIGFRGDEIATKQEGVFRIIAMGGSTTYTEMVEDFRYSYPYLLERVLKDKYGIKNVEVINAGVGGYSSHENLINLAFRVLDLEPDMIILYEGINDVHSRLVRPDTYKGDNSGRRKQWGTFKPNVTQRLISLQIMNAFFKWWPEEYRLESFIDASTADPGTIKGGKKIGGDPREVLRKNPPVYFERNLRNMIAIAAENQVEVILATSAYCPLKKDYVACKHYQEGFEEHNSIIRKLAVQKNIVLFDFAKNMPVDKKYWHDGRHVNKAGSKLKAELFADFIVQNKLLPSLIRR
jgi:lysophospholipase L1-like esterase